METDIPPEVVDQVTALAKYAREKGYAQLTVTSNRQAYFKREGSPLLSKEAWKDRKMSVLRVIGVIWMAVIMIWAYILASTSLFGSTRSLDFGWAIVLLASPWASGVIVTGALFSDGQEAKSMMNAGFFLGSMLLGMGIIAKNQAVSTLLFVMGIPCIALAYLTDARRFIAWLGRRPEETTSVK